MYIDLVTLDNQALQPFTFQVYIKENAPWVHLYYVDKTKTSRKVDVPLSGVKTSLADLVSGIPSQSRAVAFRDAWDHTWRRYGYWEA